MSYTTASERLVKAAHDLGLCDSRECDHYVKGYDRQILTDAGNAVAECLLNAFYDFEVVA